MPNIRLAELERLFAHRYGRFLPDDDDGRDSMHIVADHIAMMRGDVVGHIVAFARAWCPWMATDEATRIAEQRAASPLKYTATRLGWRLGLTKQERDLLDMRTIRYVGQSDEVMKAEKLAKDRRRKRRKRAERKVATPRPVPLSRSQPWLAEGISRATWYRKRAHETKHVHHREGLIFIADAESLIRAEIAAKPGLAREASLAASVHRRRPVLGGRLAIGVSGAVP
jgi:hypothetical protein